MVYQNDRFRLQKPTMMYLLHCYRRKEG